MTIPHGVTTDLSGLRGLSRDLSGVADEVAEAKRVIERIPAPAASTYGWAPTVDAMARVVSCWSAEVGVLGQVCNQLARAAKQSADHLQETEERITRRFEGAQFRPV